MGFARRVIHADLQHISVPSMEAHPIDSGKTDSTVSGKCDSETGSWKIPSFFPLLPVSISGVVGRSSRVLLLGRSSLFCSSSLKRMMTEIGRDEIVAGALHTAHNMFLLSGFGLGVVV